ncbi:YceI family protein [Actinoplanes sp. L3-i22]|uniref:YceI family protein n=1 Tax=Actinoplanes sp. L3-i22 TaxID=2836373 RepID=UPI001C74CB4D|nr:YceI family protein [Actinoplanes sp. L3-i22]BCY09777.1 hypothetical protein L3i22_048650 [Actinoplanes sp. L3-i22]
MTAPAARPRRRRRWWWALGITVTLVLALLATAAAAVALQPAPAPLTLPAAAAPASRPLAGHWRITSGSVAGFRVEQRFLGASSDVTGRTEAVTGTMTVRDNRIDAVEANIDLLSLTDNGKQLAPQFGTSLATDRFPAATVRLTTPVPLDDAFVTGSATTLEATGQLTLHGVTRTITAVVTAQRDASRLVVTGSVPIRFADWNLAGPKGYGALGSLADHGTAEFLFFLQEG